jgi:phosphoribosylformylglycinamidine synthase
MKARVLVRPKEGILDAQGGAVEGGLRHLGFEVGHVRVGRLIEFEMDGSDAATGRSLVEQMCEQLLANPLIESFEIQLAPSGSTLSDDDGD